jgi:hypothetical protein
MGKMVNGKSFVSTTSKTSKNKIVIGQTGVPLIQRPQRVTVLGDLPDNIRLPTDPEEQKVSPLNKWQQAQQQSMMPGAIESIVDETDEDS